MHQLLFLEAHIKNLINKSTKIAKIFIKLYNYII